MEVVQGFKALHRNINQSVVTIGNFDGVHLGHQKIIETALDQAKKKNCEMVAYSFKPHPQIALRPERNFKLLSTYEEKATLLQKLGVNVFIEEPFSREFSTTSPKEFFEYALHKMLKASVIVVGYDFSFGKERTGHLDTLQKFCDQAKIELIIVPQQKVNGEVVSSSKIRQYLSTGNVAKAADLLGHYFNYSNIVVKGDGRGTAIGIPTANFNLSSMADKVTLPHGVYATKTAVGGKEYFSVTNIGVRPTFTHGSESPPVWIETYVIDQKIDLYGSVIEVRFVDHIRNEMKFPNVAALKDQIKADIEKAKSVK
jgi:riboflavin kinase / FMN adenylyltransferase